MKELITIEDLTFNYGSQKVLDGVNVTFEQGKLSIILGRNGSGKSTLFNILAGLEKKYKGSVWIGQDERKLMKLNKGQSLRIGFLTQFHQSTFPFKVREVILTGRASFSPFSPSEEDHATVEEVLTRFNLQHLADKPYTSLSGGERQLILLCRVLVQKPDILMLDEPTNHLDLHYQVAVLKCIKQLATEGTTVLCVMHDPNLAFMFGERFYVMRENQLIDVQYQAEDQLQQLLEETYQLALHPIDNQGKRMFMPLI